MPIGIVEKGKAVTSAELMEIAGAHKVKLSL